MSLGIVWSENAKSSFKTVVDQIENKWSFKEASDFVKKANNLIGNLPDHPYLYQTTNFEDVRKAVITRQTSLIYMFLMNFIDQ